MKFTGINQFFNNCNQNQLLNQFFNEKYLKYYGKVLHFISVVMLFVIKLTLYFYLL